MGHLADSGDKTKIIRIVKSAEIAIMIAAIGIWLFGAAMLLARSRRCTRPFGPIKYAILPQHLEEDEAPRNRVVEAGTYIAILMGRSSAAWTRRISPFRIIAVALLAA